MQRVRAWCVLRLASAPALEWCGRALALGLSLITMNRSYVLCRKRVRVWIPLRYWRMALLRELSIRKLALRDPQASCALYVRRIGIVTAVVVAPSATARQHRVQWR